MSPRVCLSSLPQHRDYKPATTPGLSIYGMVSGHQTQVPILERQTLIKLFLQARLSLLIFVCLFVCLETRSHIAQAILRLTMLTRLATPGPLAYTSQVLGLQVSAPTAGTLYISLYTLVGSPPP